MGGETKDFKKKGQAWSRGGCLKKGGGGGLEPFTTYVYKFENQL